MVNHELFQNIINAYSEYEFIYNNGDKKVHGIIDLLLEKENEFIIVDYKLNNIDKEEYQNQLQTYIDYLKTKTDKPIKACLYSLKKNEVIEKK